MMDTDTMGGEVAVEWTQVEDECGDMAWVRVSGGVGEEVDA